MNLRTLLLSLALVIGAILLLWRPFAPDQEQISTPELVQRIPDFTAENLVTRIFESDGRLSHQIRAEEMSHFSDIQLTELVKPTYTSHLIGVPEQAGELWQIEAELGRFINEEKLELIEHVEVTNLSEIGYIRTIETEYLAIDLIHQRMLTDAEVLISGPQFFIRGIGMRVDLVSQQLELIEHVETIYHPRAAQQ
ncbi:LPS export ABC transporter periplasmic protein LptC [Aliidiomarina celeris]|uniref:LPS export ABC transporter periplasmic protein LptC n=1 Tax=Aliidiomarina celeris TaxID=2249428 RepID=UPI000DE94CE2|nr:LPS export ABC transporter periplasmic protein LptC [Aliidiomarina celeris]